MFSTKSVFSLCNYAITHLFSSSQNALFLYFCNFLLSFWWMLYRITSEATLFPSKFLHQTSIILSICVELSTTKCLFYRLTQTSWSYSGLDDAPALVFNPSVKLIFKHDENNVDEHDKGIPFTNSCTNQLVSSN